MSATRVRSKAGRYLADVAEPAATPILTFAESMAGTVDVLRVIAEAAQGYRQTLIDQGWSEYIVEQAAGSVLIHLQSQALGVTR